MELFLNLCWLSLLVPACLLWRRRVLFLGLHSRSASSVVPPLVFLSVLACALVLLFPVISATDDLHAMRAEMEESSPGKRDVCQSSGDKASFWHSRWQSLFAFAAAIPSIGLASQTGQKCLSSLRSLPAPASNLRASRAPPILPSFRSVAFWGSRLRSSSISS
jgi:hypothetical protein